MNFALFLLLIFSSFAVLSETSGDADLKKNCIAAFGKLSAVSDPKKSCSANAGLATQCQKLLQMSQWSVEDSANYIKTCPVENPEVDIIARHEISLEQCRKRPEERTVKIPEGHWGACPPKDVVCDDVNFPGWQNQIASVAALHREIQRAQCIKPYKTPDEVTALRGGFATMTIPKCTPPLTDNPSRVVVHHTAFPQTAGPEAMQRAHMFEIQSWSDCGYHYIISKHKDGKWRVSECRATQTVTDPVTGAKSKKFLTGAHLGPGLNSGSIGIVIAGNYEGSSQTDGATAAPGFVNPKSLGNPPPPEAVDLLNRLVHQLKGKYKSINEVTTHQKARADSIGCGNDCGTCKTVCPGAACAHLPALIGARLEK